ncbi:MAG TPA: PQQ-dependent sugar dehydrogenase, partial [Fimbriimonadaceae bacterium]|nr:PQQ-dependent sugar dehydrogenase [Fimbriimonadaceae bacterium]
MSRRGFLALAALVAAVPAFAQLRAITYVTGLNNPMYMVQDPTRPDTQYVLQRSGEIKVVVNGAIQATDYLNLTSLTTTDGERGLLSMALASDFATSGYAYIEYTDTSGNIEIKRYTRSTSNPLTLDPSTVHNVITIPHSMYDFHNGGTIAFGSDGYLYCGVGDGGPEYDPNNNAQNPNLLLGKMIRIDPSSDDFPSDDTKNYAIPPTNPFANGSGPVSALPEIWAFGYRNPFRYSFDSPGLGGNGGLVVGDVGQDAWEEVDYEPAAHGGRNYGWKQREGLHDSGLGGTSAYTPLTDPIYNCPHNGQSSAIIGGYVYRGAGLGPAFQGRYFFADDEQGKVWSMALSYDANGEATGSDIQDHTSELGTSAIGNPSAFGEDSNGDLYVINLTGGSISMIASTTMTITGHVTLQQWLGPVAGQQITIGVRRPGSTTNLDTYTTTLDALGDFSVTTNRIGHYDVAIKASHWLRKVDH